jgi:hypothetical protein
MTCRHTCALARAGAAKKHREFSELANLLPPIFPLLEIKEANKPPMQTDTKPTEPKGMRQDFSVAADHDQKRSRD